MTLKNKLLTKMKIFRFLFYPLYLFSYLIPRDKNIWLFGSGQDRFSENTKFLFIYVSKQKDSDLVPVWISGDRVLCKKLQEQNYEVLYRWGIKGLYMSLRAKYYFYNIYPTDINFYTSGNAILVNLWHGIPLKQIEFDVETGDLHKWYNTGWSYIYMFFKPYVFKRADYVLSTSDEVSTLFSSAFRVNKEQCLQFGYPRNDVFFNTENIIQDNSNTSHLSIQMHSFKIEGKRVLIYMPTWRNNRDFFEDAIPDFKQLNQVLKNNALVIYMKPHPMTHAIKEVYSNIFFIDPNEDIYPLLSLSDYLITDYSSIYFDYLLLDKEIIFYPFDYEVYIKEERKLYFKYDEVTPGIKISTFESFLQTLSELETLDFLKHRLKIKNMFWSFKDGDASQRIYTYLSKE